MELNWSTFLLEIFNFLVLVWILKRFLYRPVMSVLDERRKKIEKSLDEATSHHSEAVALEKKYQARLAAWETEKQQARETLQQEIQTERIKKMEQLQIELDSKKEKDAIIGQRNQAETQRQYQQKSHDQGARFVSKLLNEIAGPELESRLFDLLIKSFDGLGDASLFTLRDACKNDASNITVTSAYTLSDSQQQQLEQKLVQLCEQTVVVNYAQDSDLLAGLRICIGAWILRANLQDELNAFVELSHENTIS